MGAPQAPTVTWGSAFIHWSRRRIVPSDKNCQIVPWPQAVNTTDAPALVRHCPLRPLRILSGPRAGLLGGAGGDAVFDGGGLAGGFSGPRPPWRGGGPQPGARGKKPRGDA